jgi:transcriptional regulator with XRE-family HTH domain
MPRPSKHISPDTLGGRIRAAREDQHLSLADVAKGQYSTSLISQIERNRVDPSHESLRFLAERLKLPLEDLEMLAKQHREAEVEARQYKSYEELRIEAAQLLKSRDVQRALRLLEDLHFSQIPPMQRWRLAALRGQCYFEQRQFLKAQQDFVYALQELPKQEGMPTDQKYELMLLHLHLAASYRELEIPAALEHYQITLKMMNQDTPFGYVAEAHWGMALIAFTQAYKMRKDDPLREQKLRTALEHAENARFLYRSISEPLRAAAVTVQIAQIEKELGNQQSQTIRRYLQEILDTWQHVLEEPEAASPEDQRHQKEQANIVSVAACSLAGMALEAGNIDEALTYVKCALQAAERSYKVRQADAHIMHGRILEAMNLYDPAAEEAFRHATKILEDTDRIAARSSAHSRLARHLIKKGKTEEGDKELETAHTLVDQVVARQASTRSAEDPAQ